MQANTVNLIKTLEQTSSTNEKKSILLQAYEDGERHFFTGMKLTYNKMISFGVKKVPSIDAEDDGVDDLPFLDFIDLTRKLRNRELTGHAARDAIEEAAQSSGVDVWNYFYRRILLRDMKIGVTSTLVNSVLKTIGGEALDYLVPKFQCQLAVDSKGHPKKMAGKKFIDVKLDGARMLTVLDKEAGEVSMFSRNGIEQFNFPHIRDALKQMLPHLQDSIVLDGEILSDTFQNLMSQFQRKDATTVDMKLGLFDIIPMREFLTGESKMTQTARHEMLVELQTSGALRQFCGDSVYVIPKLTVDLDTPEGQKEMREFFDDAVAAGFEGIMIKCPKAGYKGSKGSNWMKWKPTISVTLKVVGVEEGEPESKYEGMLGKLICEGADEVDGETIRIKTACGSGITDEQRKLWWDDHSLIMNYLVEIEADAATQSQDAEDGVYSLRFPRFKGVRGTKPNEKI